MISPIPRELPFSPMMVLAIGIEHPLDATVQRFHDADPREHCRTAQVGNEYECLDRGLPLRQIGFVLREPGNIGRRLAQGAELLAFGQGDRILKLSRPAPFANDPDPS